MARPAPTPVQSGTTPERSLEAALRRAGIDGWEAQPHDLGGAQPDFFFRHTLPSPVAVYVDGCQWHGCARHYRPHRGAHGLSPEGVQRQRHRDRINTAMLEARGMKVLRLWSHEIKADADVCARRVKEALGR